MQEVRGNDDGLHACGVDFEGEVGLALAAAAISLLDLLLLLVARVVLDGELVRGRGEPDRGQDTGRHRGEERRQLRAQDLPAGKAREDEAEDHGVLGHDVGHEDVEEAVPDAEVVDDGAHGSEDHGPADEVGEHVDARAEDHVGRHELRGDEPLQEGRCEEDVKGEVLDEGLARAALARLLLEARHRGDEDLDHDGGEDHGAEAELEDVAGRLQQVPEGILHGAERARVQHLGEETPVQPGQGHQEAQPRHGHRRHGDEAPTREVVVLQPPVGPLQRADGVPAGYVSAPCLGGRRRARLAAAPSAAAASRPHLRSHCSPPYPFCSEPLIEAVRRR
mmetsp:Transcript_19275/g.40469  ORF Transcript_19275/g.40469 Transcript_19275/m.40469 type:complete len:335 (-) Transcript_19275:73-1077(-)